MAQISKRGNKIVPDRKDHDFAKDGFNYRTGYFRDFDGTYYRLNISVGLDSDNKTVYNIGKIDEVPFPAFSGSKASGKTTSAKGNSVDTSITNPDENVKTDYSVVTLPRELVSDTVTRRQTRKNARKIVFGIKHFAMYFAFVTLYAFVSGFVVNLIVEIP